MYGIDQTTKQRLLNRFNALKSERDNGWQDHWRDISENIHPRQGRFVVTDWMTAGTKKHSKIINSTPTRASDIQAAGLMSGASSPARPWFKLGTPDPEVAEYGTVRSWLNIVEERIRGVFDRSNIYLKMHESYLCLGDYGTSCAFIDEDPRDVLRGYFLPIGSYCLATDGALRVDTVFRETTLTVSQIVDRFPRENISDQIMAAHANGQLDQRFEVIHCVEPNRKMRHGVMGPEGMPFLSYWLEKGGDDGRVLDCKGYYEFPILAPRWDVNGEDTYGSSPGMTAIGDIRALQIMEKRKAQMIDKLNTPPTRGPSSVARGSLLPGDYTPYDGASQTKFEPVYIVPPQAIPAVSAEIAIHERRINSVFAVDLWLMLARNDGPQMTAREIAERHEEKLLQLGPTLTRLQDELFKPLIDRAFGALLRRGELPPPPEEIQGMELRVEYTSMLAQAQKMLAVSGIDRFVSTVIGLAQAKPEVLDKLNADEVVDEYAAGIGIKPDLVNTDEEVAVIRQARAQQASAQQQMMQAQITAQGAKTLSEVDTSGDNALTRVMQNMAGVGPAGTG